MIDPVTFVQVNSVSNTVIINVRSFFDLTFTEFNILSATMLLLNDKNFKTNSFSRKDIAPIINAHTSTIFKDKRKSNLYMTALMNKEFFIYVGNVSETKDGKHSRINRYIVNKEKFAYFCAILQAFTAIELAKFARYTTNSVGRFELFKFKKDAIKHIKKMKKLIKKK
jgi:hypothetical protein